MALGLAVGAQAVPTAVSAEPMTLGDAQSRHETLAALSAGFRTPVKRGTLAMDDAPAPRSWADGGLKPLGHRLAAPADLIPVLEPIVKLEPMLSPAIEQTTYVEPVVERPAISKASLHGNPLRVGESAPAAVHNPLR